jgi:hypothetical protein
MTGTASSRGLGRRDGDGAGNTDKATRAEKPPERWRKQPRHPNACKDLVGPPRELFGKGSSSTKPWNHSIQHKLDATVPLPAQTSSLAPPDHFARRLSCLLASIHSFLFASLSQWPLKCVVPPSSCPHESRCRASLPMCTARRRRRATTALSKHTQVRSRLLHWRSPCHNHLLLFLSSQQCQNQR